MNKQAFQQYRQLCREIKELEEEKEALAAGQLPASWPLGRRGRRGGGRVDAVGDTAARLWQLSQLLAQRLNQLIALRGEIEAAIEDLEPEERRLVRLYYIEGLTWEQTAERLDYSVRHLCRMQREIMRRLFPQGPPQEPTAAAAAPCGS